MAVAGVALAASCGSGSDRQAAPAAEPRWQRIEPGGATRCARGGKYAFWLRRADPKRPLVFFQGGGGCFSEETCRVGSSWFDDRIERFDDPTGSGGVLDFANPSNPFRDYSVVYIPSRGVRCAIGSPISLPAATSTAPTAGARNGRSSGRLLAAPSPPLSAWPTGGRGSRRSTRPGRPHPRAARSASSA